MAARDNIVQTQWRDFLQELDSVQSRRWKTATRQSTIEIVSIGEKGVEAKAKWFGGGGRRTFSVKMPTVGWWAPYRDRVAIWLARRPDWQASLLAHEWNEEFLDFLTSAGLNLFPEADYLEKLKHQAVCSCSNPEVPCIHMMAVLDLMMRQQEMEPYRALEYVGLPFETLLNDAHEFIAQELEAEPKELQELQGSPSQSTPESEAGSNSESDSEADSDSSPQSTSRLVRSVTDGTNATHGVGAFGGVSDKDQSVTMDAWPQEDELMSRLKTLSVVAKERNTQFPFKISAQRLNYWRDYILVD